MAPGEASKLGHIWQPAPAGAGGEPVCKQCGVRKREAESRMMRCKIIDFRPRKVVSDYEPFAEPPVDVA